MRKSNLLLLPLVAFAGFSVQGATLVYYDTFDDGVLGVNADTGGGAAFSNVGTGTSNFIEQFGRAQYGQTGGNFANAALLYSTNNFQSDGGFELSVSYRTSSINNLGRNMFGFGLLEAATTYSTSSNPFTEVSSAYSIGVNVINHTNSGTTRGLWHANGTAVSSLDVSGTIQDFIADAVIPVVLRVEADGSGGADWSYSINGVTEASGNLPSFDFSKSFHFAAYGQDDEADKFVNLVSLTAVPEPTSLPLFGLGFLCLLGVRRVSRG